MGAEHKARVAVRVACLGIGLLFVSRGALLPYFFPVFEHLTDLSYAEIAILLNLYVFSQSLGAPVAGWFTDRTSIRFAIATAIILEVVAFLTVSQGPAFVVCAMAMSLAGLGFVLGKIALNTLLVDNSSPESLRGSIAVRAALLNIGSFVGNLLAFYTIEQVGYHSQFFLLVGLNLALGITFLAPVSRTGPSHKTLHWTQIAAILKNRKFLADTLRLFSIYLPYGCWGTIIPKFVIDTYQSTDPIRFVYLTSLVTVIIGSHVVNGYLAKKLYAWGFQWCSWICVAKVCYCLGLLLLTFAANPLLLTLAIVIFICGEIVMTPCLAEIAKRYAQPGETGTYQGVLHLFEGGGRVIGSATALFIYGLFKGSGAADFYWSFLTAVFMGSYLVIRWVASRLDLGCSPLQKGSDPCNTL